MSSNFNFELEQEDKREQMAEFIKSRGLSGVDAKEIVALALRVANAIVGDPKYKSVKASSKNKLPEMIINVLGPKFTDHERQILKTNYPVTGVVIPENYWDANVRSVLIRFSNELNMLVAKWVNEQNLDPTKDSGTNVHFIVYPGRDTLHEDYEKLLAYLNNIDGVGIERFPDNPIKSEIFYSAASYRPQVELINSQASQSQQAFGITAKRIKVTTSKVDDLTMEYLRGLATKLGYKVFSVPLGVYLPLVPGIFDIYNGQIRPEVQNILRVQGYEPLFFLHNSPECYARRNGEESIHIINGELLYYFVNNPIEQHTTEFSYAVADSLYDFVSKYEAGLIPAEFYRYFNKPLKIINWGDFDIENIDRKVFIKPYIFELNKMHQGFYTVSGANGGAISMTKVLSGQKIEDALREFLKNELEIADDFIGATVEPQMEFDLDKMQNITPRLIMRVYLHENSISQEQRERLKKGWIGKRQLQK